MNMMMRTGEEMELRGMGKVSCADFERLLGKRRRAVRACDRIGWNGNRKQCPDLGRMKHRFGYIVERGCGDGGVDKWRKKVSVKELRCGNVKGVSAPPPSNEPRPRGE